MPVAEELTALTVIGVFVVPVQVARPFVASWAELIFALVGSETVQDGVRFMMICGTAQLESEDGLGRENAENFCRSPGAIAKWSAVAIAGETELMLAVGHGAAVPQPVRTALIEASDKVSTAESLRLGALDRFIG